MSWVTVIWSITASACMTLAAICPVVWRTCLDASVDPIRSNAARFVPAKGRVGGTWIWLLAAMFSMLAFETWAAKSFRSDPDYLIDTWETEDGLPENSATAMVQTPDGYLWFGTFNGLVRFDGVKFTVFNPFNTPDLPSAVIVNLHQDHNGRLWVSTDRGLVVREGERWRSFGANAGWAGNYVRTFAERANGDLLMTTFDGHVLEFVGGRLSELPAPPGKQGQGYLAHVDEAGQWWVVQDWFVGRWDGHRWVETVRFLEPFVEGIACGTAPDGSLLLVANLELRRYRKGTEVQRVPLKERPDSVWSVTEDSAGNIWFASYAKGLSCLQPDGGFRHWQTDGLVYHNTRFVFEDRERNLWVGTSGDGLMRFKPRRFRAFGLEAGLAERTVKSIWPDGSGGLWIGSFGQGLFHLGAAGITNVPLPDCESTIIYCQSVLQDRARRIWVGTMERGVWLLEGPVGRRIPARQTGGGTISALFEDSRGRVWIAGDKGLAVFESGAFRIVEREGNLQTGGVVCFGEDRNGVLWLSNLAAVLRRENDRLVEVRTADGQPLREIQCFKAETDGTMWMGTRGDGLWRWRDGRIDRLGPASGFPVQVVNTILDDGLGYFWMPSNRGIVRAAQKKLHAVADGAARHLECQLLDQNDGLPSLECPPGQPTCARDGTGRLWFATQRGVGMIDPAGLRLNLLPPPVRIEQLTYYLPGAKTQHRDHPASDTSDGMQVRLRAPFPDPLRLPPGSYGLEINYTALSYTTPEKIQFQTMLKGTGRDWEDSVNKRVNHFYEIQPGPYVFRVRAANNDGVWNEAGTSLAFTVRPFYWQTAWFRVVAGLLLAAVGGGAVLWQNRSRRRLELAEMEHLRRESADRKRADERFRRVVEASPSGIVLVDEQGRVILVNAQIQTLFGYTREELVGQAVDLLVPDHFRAGHQVHRASFHQAPAPRLMGQGRELFGRRKDGTEFPLEIGLSYIQGPEGILVLAAVVDLTARKQAEAEMSRQRAELAHVVRVSTMGELAASVAHELNQPLGAILSNAEAAELFLNQDPPALGELRAILADIRKDDERAGEVIRRMRALLRKREVEREPLEMNLLVEDVFRLVGADARLRTTALVAQLSPHLPRVEGDRVQFQQVLLNLIMNAMDAMNNQPNAKRRLIVRTSHTGDGKVELSVSDSGPGIEPDSLPRLFEPFFTTKPNGIGMGLSISRKIVEAHHGRIWAENHPAGGAVFRVQLPGARGERK